MATTVEIGDRRYFLKQSDFKDFSDKDLINLENWVSDELEDRFDDPFKRNEDDEDD
tara:strand:+ start:25 stop:192 length:168 start_codon:yes stop_codon:yes gene_type:complete